MPQIKQNQVNIGPFLLAFRFDGKIFCVALRSACPFRKRRGKIPRQIRYLSFCEWALKITKIQQEVTYKYENHLEEVLHYIRALKGEILEDWYKALLK